MDVSINPINLGGPLVNRNGRSLDMNTAIVMGSNFNVGIGFVVPMDGFKSAVEDIVSTYSLLRRGKGKNWRVVMVVGRLRDLWGWTS